MNPYDVLGLPADASKFDVRNAYRQAAKKHHPDAGGDPEAFRDVTLAHDVLTDDLRRARFDETGQIDEKEADNHDAEATKRFLIVVSNALDRAQDMARQRNKPAFCFDVLGLAKIELIEHIDGVRKQIKATKKKLAMNEDAARRFARTDGKSDIVGAMLNRNMTAFKATIENCEREITMTEAALEIFEGYTFTKDPDPQPEFKTSLGIAPGHPYMPTEDDMLNIAWKLFGKPTPGPLPEAGGDGGI
jgi:hypothetical protein